LYYKKFTSHLEFWIWKNNDRTLTELWEHNFFFFACFPAQEHLSFESRESNLAWFSLNVRRTAKFLSRMYVSQEMLFYLHKKIGLRGLLSFELGYFLLHCNWSLQLKKFIDWTSKKQSRKQHQFLWRKIMLFAGSQFMGLLFDGLNWEIRSGRNLIYPFWVFQREHIFLFQHEHAKKKSSSGENVGSMMCKKLCGEK